MDLKGQRPAARVRTLDSKLGTDILRNRNHRSGRCVVGAGRDAASKVAGVAHYCKILSHGERS